VLSLLSWLLCVRGCYCRGGGNWCCLCWCFCCCCCAGGGGTNVAVVWVAIEVVVAVVAAGGGVFDVFGAVYDVVVVAVVGQALLLFE